MLKILGHLHFKVAVDAGSSVGFNLEEISLIFFHGEGVFFLFEVVSK